MNKSLLILNEIVERVNNNKETILDKPKWTSRYYMEYIKKKWILSNVWRIKNNHKKGAS